jgi:hypothetical protein
LNIKSFLFWSGVVALGILAAYMLMEWLKTPAMALLQKPRREIGFHAVNAEVQAEAAAT